MGEVDVEKLISYSDDLVKVLKDKRDLNNLSQCLRYPQDLRPSCDAELKKVQNLIRDYEKKVDACHRQTEVAKSEVVADEELDLLQIELAGLVDIESLATEELRVITEEVDDLDRRRISLLEKKRISKKQEQDEFKKQRKRSMYASVTNIIPNLEDQSSDSGYIVNRDKKRVAMFEFDPRMMTAFETCNAIWKKISDRS